MSKHSLGLLALILFNFLFTGQSFSMTVSGYVSRVDNDYWIKPIGQSLPDSKSLKISYNNRVVRSNITKINNGDFIIAQGKVHPLEKRVFLDSIDLVGLKNLLGKWRTVNWGIYEFNSFNKVSVSDSFFSQLGSTDSPIVKAEYNLSPNQGSSWAIFMTTKDSVFIGKMMLKGYHLKMVFFDSTSGNIQHKVKLMRF